MTVLAMPVVLDGPLPSEPEHCLLAVPGVVVPGDGHWEAGATIYPYPVDVPSTWEPCSVGTFRVKGDGSAWPLPQFSPFAAYIAITCSSMSIGDPDEFRGRAEIALDAVQSFAVEQALSQGVSESPNPFFLDGNEDLPNGLTAVRPDVGLAFLEEAIGESGRNGLIHLTPAVAAALGYNFLRERNTPANTTPLTTTAGTHVSVGGGYKGAHRINHTVATGQSWCFATGPVEVRISDADLIDISQTLDRSENIVTFRAEKYVLAVWDTQVQTAILVDWTL